MPFTSNAPSIKEMLADYAAGTATREEIAALAAERFAREGKSDGWYARYAALTTKIAGDDPVTVADVFPQAAPAPVVPAAAQVSPDAAPAASWSASCEAVLAAAPNATTAQVAAFASKLIRAHG